MVDEFHDCAVIELGVSKVSYIFAEAMLTRIGLDVSKKDNIGTRRMTSGISGIEGWVWVAPFRARSVLGPRSEGDAPRLRW